jgi:hypothetical protein
VTPSWGEIVRGRALRIAAGAVAVLAVVAGIGWAAAPWIEDAYREWRSQQPLNEHEAAAAAACVDPGWGGLVKLIEQDLPDACSPLWFADVAAPHLARRGERRAARLVAIAEDPARPSRARVRAGLTLVRAGRPTLPELALLTRRPELAEARAALPGALVDSGWPVDWVDPELSLELALRDEGERGVGPALVAALRDLATRDDAAAAVRRAELTARALDELGFDLDLLRQATLRAASGGSLGHVPGPVAAFARAHGAACEAPDAPACALVAASALADRLQAPDDAVEVSEAPPDAPPLDLAALLHPTDGAARAALEGRVARYAAFVAAAAHEGRARRMIALLTDGAGGGAPTASMAQALHDQRADPWIAALAAWDLGESSGVPVTVGWATGRVAIDVGGERRWIDACGRAAAPVEGEAWPTAWPRRAVLAQAVAAAARAEEGPGRSRLLALAAGLDPVGVGPPPVAAGSPAEAAGRWLGAAVAAHWSAVPDAARAERAARAGAILAGEPLDCPPR